MRRTLATGTMLPLALVLALALTGCNGDNAAKKASGPRTTASASTLPTDLPTGLPTELPSCLGSALPTALPTNPTEVPSDLASCLPSNLPTDLPTDVPTSLPTDVPTAAEGGALEACTIVTGALITADFGVATAGQALPQASSYNDPDARDCYYFGGAATVVVQATTRADADMPADSNSYEGVPGAIQIKGADRGWAFVFAGDDSSSTGGLIVVKGQNGLNVTVSTQGSTFTVDDLQKLADDILPAL